MSYETLRNHQIHDIHQRKIETFANAYRVGKPTIVLLPGGMGSRLDRSKNPYKGDSIPPGPYNQAWMNLDLIFGRALENLAIEDDQHDLNDYFVIPNGPLEFLVNAYDGTRKYFAETLGWNFVTFAYDWRRSIAEAASQLEDFLFALQARVKKTRDVDPLPTTTLLAHSQGGLVAKVFLHRVAGDDGSGIAKVLQRLVTVATPFYGTATHHDRYYQGQAPLNTFYGKKRVAQISGTLPGPYILMYADANVLDSKTRKKLGLTDYPLTDSVTGSAVDPYDPANAHRHPPWVRKRYLEEAALIRETIAAPLPDPVARRVFHIRSGLNAATGAAQVWRDIKGANYDPSTPSPITLVPGAGDGTVPFWSARLAQTPASRVFDLAKASDHGALAEHLETLTVIRNLVEKGKFPAAASLAAVPDESLGTPKASPAKVNKFIADVQSGAIAKNDPAATDPEVWRRLLEEMQIC